MNIKIQRTGPRGSLMGAVAAGGQLTAAPLAGAFAFLVFLVAAPTPTRAQERPAPPAAAESEVRCLTLAEAEALALDGNRGLMAGRARAEAVEARADGAGTFVWPHLAAEAGFTRSDDPVAAFGTRLRQARFTEADFGLDALNRPDAVEDWTGAVGVQWSALDPGRWAGRASARHGARAARLGVERSAEAVRFRTRVLYLEALRAEAALDAARAGEDAAVSTALLMRSRRSQGVLTDADVLQAEAALEAARASTVAAERAVADARGRLALHLGLPEGVEVIPDDRGLELDPPLGPVGFDAPGAAASAGAGPATSEETGTPEAHLASRPDLRAALAQVDAAGAGLRQARAARLPSVDAFARLSSHAPDPFDGREANVTLGLQLSVPLFTGGGIGSAVDEARALERATRLEYEDRLAEARTELAEARRSVEAARRGAEAAEAARTAADEAQRLVRRRFEEGLATTSELLQAEARAAELRTAAVDARAGYRQALAFLAFVVGDPTHDPDPNDS